MQLGPETGIPQVQSYFDKRSARRRRLCSPGAVGYGGFSSDVFALIHANVRNHAIWSTVIIGSGAKGVPHSRNAAKISNTLGIGIHRIERGCLIGRSWKKLIEEPIWWKDVATMYGNWLNSQIRYRVDLRVERDDQDKQRKQKR